MTEKGNGGTGMVHRIRNKDINGRYENKTFLFERVDLGTLRWFGHRMDEGRLTKRIYRADVGDVRKDFGREGGGGIGWESL